MSVTKLITAAATEKKKVDHKHKTKKSSDISDNDSDNDSDVDMEALAAGADIQNNANDIVGSHSMQRMNWMNGESINRKLPLG